MTEIMTHTLTIVAGILLGRFEDKIIIFFTFSKKYKHLLGTWSCSWKENPSTKNPQGKTTFDMLEITSAKGKYLKGKGDAKGVGNWNFRGEVSKDTITFLYRAEKGTDKSGVIILARDLDDEKKLLGAWCQFRKGEIINGTTEWEKH